MRDEPPSSLLDLPDGRTVGVRVVRQTLVGDRWRRHPAGLTSAHWMSTKRGEQSERQNRGLCLGHRTWLCLATAGPQVAARPWLAPGTAGVTGANAPGAKIDDQTD